MKETDFKHDLHNLKFNAWSEYKKPVVQYAKDGTRLKRYDSITEAAQAIGIANTCIIKCCKTYRGTAGGFKWLYADI